MSPADLAAAGLNAVAIGAGGLTVMLAVSRLPRLSASDRRPMMALIAITGILTLDCAASVYELSGAAVRHPQLIGGSILLLAWLPTALWLYVLGLVGRGDERRGSVAAHVAVSALSSLCVLPLLLLPGGDRLALMQDRLVISTPGHIAMMLGLSAFILLWSAHLVIAGVLTVRRLLRHRRELRDICSEVAGLELGWIDGLLLLVVCGVALTVADHLLLLGGGRALLDAAGSALFEGAIILGFALFGLDQRRAVPVWAEDPEVLQGPPPEPADDAAGRYARSSLTDADCADIVARLDRVMREQEPWRDPFLNLKGLAASVPTRPYYLTQALNTALDRNFYDYVNGWRIAAARAALEHGDAPVLTICEEVGFNSKSTFNTVFRRETGLTPSAYRQARVADPE